MRVYTQVLEAASAGNFNAKPLRFGQALSDRVDKSGCHYYTLDLQQSHIDSGFVIGAHSAAGSRFKLLMFEKTSDSPGANWELVIQEDSMKVMTQAQSSHVLSFGISAIPRQMEGPVVLVCCWCRALAMCP